MNMQKESYTKEYAILCIYNGGTPFILRTHNNIQEAKLHLYNLVNLEEDRNRVYYVDNDFFDNKYQNLLNGKYFKILERTVGGWEHYKEIIKDKNNTPNNIIQLKNYLFS